MFRHDSSVRGLGQLVAQNLDPRPALEQIIPELARPVAGQIGEARLDIVAHEGASRILVDVVVVSVLALTAHSGVRALAEMAMQPAGLKLPSGLGATLET